MVYTYQPVNPAQGFMQGMQMVQGIRDMQMQRDEMQSKQLRQQALQEALTNVRSNPTPQNIADFYLQFPEMKQQFDAYRETLAEGDKVTLEGAAREAIVANQQGKSAAEVFARYAEAAENSRRPDLAQKFRDAQQTAEMSPEAADTTARMFFEALNPAGYKELFGSGAQTALQKDFAFIKDTFGEDAAAEFAQFGRGGIVSIPLPDGSTYVGPPSLAPGAGRWQQQGGQPTPEQPQTAENILAKASDAKVITQAEANVIKQSLGPNGQAAFSKWMRENNIKVIARTGRDASGRRVVQYADGTIEYAD
jgi:hypothetical protein